MRDDRDGTAPQFDGCLRYEVCDRIIERLLQRPLCWRIRMPEIQRRLLFEHAGNYAFFR